ncbi:hypothetical protein NHE_0594 [Neorickettsia helminthoeca str. Oregon]|uniref:Uncharacterized protein n=1 Tax=Neorickettsia helminthoeca str. Oregon TaxID=1286528 RepID=X5H4Q1_9RICK|nr:hypothetical protein NHE_0594 [Neorickettsia helminthoeca str. Oregon]
MGRVTGLNNILPPRFVSVFLSKIIEEVHFGITELAMLASSPRAVVHIDVKQKVSWLSRKIEMICSSDISEQEKLSVLKEMQSLLKKVVQLSVRSKESRG